MEDFLRNGWHVVTAIGWLGRTADDAASDYAALGCEVMRLPDDMAYAGIESNASKSAAAKAPEARPPTRPGLLRRVASSVRLIMPMRNMGGRLSRFMDSVKPDVVLSGPFHSCGRFDNGFAREARRRGILHCCYPVSGYHGTQGSVSARFSNLAMGMLPPVLRSDYDLLNRCLAWAFRGWTQTRDGKTIFMWDPVIMLAARLTGLMARDIWQKPSPDFDTVFVFNRFSLNLLESNGFPMDKVVVSGIPLLDASVTRAADPAARQAMLADLGLADGEAFLLFNVEPSAEHHYCDWDRHWENFRAMMRLVTAQGLPVVLSLHPLCRPDDYLFAESEFGVRISRAWKIHDLYPVCAFVVSFPCSTNLIAEVFGKPLAIYDFFLMAHPDSPRVAEFRLPGALVGHTIDQIAANVAQLAASLHREAERSCSDAVPPAPTFVMASDVIRRHVESLLKARGEGGLACAN